MRTTIHITRGALIKRPKRRWTIKHNGDVMDYHVIGRPSESDATIIRRAFRKKDTDPRFGLQIGALQFNIDDWDEAKRLAEAVVRCRESGLEVTAP